LTNKFSSKPENVKNMAFNSAEFYCKESYYGCKNFKLTSTLVRFDDDDNVIFYEKEISDADKENGVEERWYILISFIHHDTEWRDGHIGVICEKINGKWTNPCPKDLLSPD
jgi:hypothetical protein